MANAALRQGGQRPVDAPFRVLPLPGHALDQDPRQRLALEETGLELAEDLEVGLVRGVGQVAEAQAGAPAGGAGGLAGGGGR